MQSGRTIFDVRSVASVTQIFNNKDHADNLYGERVEVDYRGYEVTVENFLRVLTGPRTACLLFSCCCMKPKVDCRSCSVPMAQYLFPARMCPGYIARQQA